MTRAVLALVVACAGACARTQDIYVGSDLVAQPSDGAQGAGRMDESAGAASPSEPPPTSSGGSVTPPAQPEDGGDDAQNDLEPPDAGPASDSGEPPEVVTCPPGQADCDGDPDNGCETGLATDPDNCGACGAACTTPDCACEDGRPVVSCPAGRGDCDGDAQNGCEVDLQTELEHCGACDRGCHADGPRVMAAACNAGQCELSCQLANYWGDCDGDPDNGCETDLFHDVAHCGACGMRCNACLDGICL